MLAAALLAAGCAVAAASTAAADADLQVRRTSPSGDAQVRLAVLPGASDATGGGATTSAAEPVRVSQAGRRLQADTEPLLAAGRPLSVVVVVRPDELTAAQALVADALVMLPEDVRVHLAPVSAPVSAPAGASSAPLAPSDALAALDRLTAQPSASGLVAGDGSAGTLVVTSCPGGQLPDVGAVTGWVLGWGADCASGTPGRPAGLVVDRAATLAGARSAVPGLMARVLAARSVRVTPPGPQPLTVTASGSRTTVLLTGGPEVGRADRAAGGARGAAGGARGAAAAPAGAAATGTTSSVEARIVPLVWALALGAVGAAVLAGAVLLVLRRRRAAAATAWQSASPGDDPWSGLVPDWGRPREEDL